MHAQQRVTVAAGLLGAATLLAGCAGQPAPRPGDLRFTAAWQAWGDDPLSHLVLSLYNEGGTPLSVGPGGSEITISGPAGPVPVYWGETSFAREVAPGAALAVGLHPRAAADGLFGLAIDHDWGVPAPPLPGLYTVCIGQECTLARLA